MPTKAMHKVRGTEFILVIRKCIDAKDAPQRGAYRYDGKCVFDLEVHTPAKRILGADHEGLSTLTVANGRLSQLRCDQRP